MADRKLLVYPCVVLVKTSTAIPQIWQFFKFLFVIFVKINCINFGSQCDSDVVITLTSENIIPVYLFIFF